MAYKRKNNGNGSYMRNKNNGGISNATITRRNLPIARMCSPNKTGRNGELTEQQELFCREFLVDMNITQAAIRAGYSVRSGGVNGWQVFKHKKVRNRINELMARRNRRVESRFKNLDLKSERVLLELASIAFINFRDFLDDNDKILPSSEWTPEMGAAISSIEVEELYDGRGEDKRWIGRLKKIRMHPKIEALKLTMKYLGLIHDSLRIKTEHTETKRLEIDLKAEQIRRLNLGREELEQFTSILSQLAIQERTNDSGAGSKQEDTG